MTAENLPMRRTTDPTCRICGRECETLTSLDGMAVHICDRCSRLVDVEYRRDQNTLLIVRRSTGEVAAEAPIEYTDAKIGRMEMVEWIGGASLAALARLWDMTQENKQYLLELQYRIAAEVHRRLGFYGGHWHEEAGKLLRRSHSVVRDYAYIWERLGEQITEDARLLDLGFDLLRRAAFANDDGVTLERFVSLQDRGVPVKKILDLEGGPGEPKPLAVSDIISGPTASTSGHNPPDRICETHVWVCANCGVPQEALAP